MTRWAGILLLSLCFTKSNAQVTGGQYAFAFLRLSNAPHISALGGINVASTDDDIAFALQNPSLMRPSLHNELELTYNNYYAGISVANLQYGYHSKELNTSFAFGVQYLNYGNFTQTDDLGNNLGTFTANDYALTVAASHNYGDHWRAGVDLKYAHSQLFAGSAAAVLTDVGISYYDTASQVCFGAVAKNMGLEVKKYVPGLSQEPLPFDLQMGITKQFKHIPLKLFTTIHHFYEWDIRYSNPADVTTSTILGTDSVSSSSSSHFADILFRHFIFGGELTLAKRLTLTVSYNDLMRSELALASRTGVTGFSFGAALHLDKFQIHYARSYYHLAGAYNEIGITMALNKLFGIGTTGEKIHWNETYKDEWSQD